MIKLIAMDLDGTLLDSTKSLPAGNKDAIEKYAAAGIEFAFCTGRVKNELTPISNALPCVKYAITCNGAYVRDLVNDKEVSKDLLPMEMVRPVYKLLKEKGYAMMFELQADGVVYAQKSCIQHPECYGVDYIRQLIQETRVPVEDMGEYLEQRGKAVGKVNIFFPEPNIRSQAFHDLKNFPYDFSYSEPSNLEINKHGVHKGLGLKNLAEYLHLSLEKVMAIGDNYNDVALLKTAGCSVAMANSPEDVKQYAMYTTAGNDELGVAKAIERFAG